MALVEMGPSLARGGEPVRYPPHPLTSDEAARLLDACGRGWAATRNRALIALMYRAGLRVGEACGLELGAVRFDDEGCGVVRVAKPKGWQRERNPTPPREVGLDPKTCKLVREWIEVRVRHSCNGASLFVTRNGAPVQTSYVRQLLPLLGRRAGLERRVHAHALRHTFARQLYDEGIGLVEIMGALGHTSLATTQKYLRSIGATEVINATSRREW